MHLDRVNMDNGIEAKTNICRYGMNAVSRTTYFGLSIMFLTLIFFPKNSYSQQNYDWLNNVPSSVTSTPVYSPDFEFLERMQSKANAQYERRLEIIQAKADALYKKGRDEVIAEIVYLNSLNLVNEYNSKKLELYKSTVDNYVETTAPSVDYSQQSNVVRVINIVNRYRDDKTIMDEIELLSKLSNEISLLKNKNPETYRTFPRYGEIGAILKALKTCLPQEISNLESQIISEKQGISTSNASASFINAGEYYKQAQEKYKAGDFKAALQAINKSIENSQEHSAVFYFRGFLYTNVFHYYDEAIRDFTRAFQMDPHDKYSLLFRGQAYEKTQKLTEALKDYTEAIKIDSLFLPAYFSRALLKDDFGDFIGAIKDYDFIISNDEGTKTWRNYLMATVYNNKGYGLVNLGKYKQALPVINRAIELGPDESYIWGSRGVLYYKTQQYKKCIADMTKALDLLNEKKNKAQDITMGQEKYYYRGLAKIKTGEKKGGCEDLSKAGELGMTGAYDDIKRYCR